MTENKMYSQRTHNIAFHRGCGEDKNGCNEKWCNYCAFERLVAMNRKCPDCVAYRPHTHPEVLNRKPPKTKNGSFVTFSLAGEVSFMKDSDWLLAWDYIRKCPETTFLIQSKNPACFLKWQAMIPRNCIIGTTVETNKREFTSLPYQTDFPHYDYISGAPYPDERVSAMMELYCRHAITIEPILDFDLWIMVNMLRAVNPLSFVYIGYANDGKQGKRLKLPEPPLAKTQELITRLRESGIEVREKSIRKAWREYNLQNTESKVKRSCKVG